MSEKQDAVALRTDAVPAEAMLPELGALYDVPMRVAIEVGRMRLRVRDLIKLAAGTVIQLRKPAGEPFDICVNGVTVGRGEVILVEQSFGVRIIEVAKPGGGGA